MSAPGATWLPATWLRTLEPISLGALCLALVFHQILAGNPLSISESGTGSFYASPGLPGVSISGKEGIWGIPGRLVLLCGLALLLTGLIVRLVLRRGSEPWRRMIGFPLAGLAAVGAGILLFAFPDEHSPGLPWLRFDLPLRGLLLALSAAALLLALRALLPRAVPGRRRPLAAMVMGGALAGILGVLLIPQPTDAYTPYALALHCDGLPAKCCDALPGCQGPLQTEPRSLASPIALVPEAWKMQSRSVQRLRHRLAHLERMQAEPMPAASERLAHQGPPDERSGSGAHPEERSGSGAHPEERSIIPGILEREPVDPLHVTETRNGILHLRFTQLRWLALGLALLFGMALSLVLWRRGPGGTPVLLLGLGTAIASVTAATSLLPYGTWVSLASVLPSTLLGPLMVLGAVSLWVSIPALPLTPRR